MIASHIKPWSVCNEKECIDPDNGLLLNPNIDFLFDKGYISFDDKGYVLFSKKMESNVKREFAIDEKMKIKQLNGKLREYLEFHRKNIFLDKRN